MAKPFATISGPSTGGERVEEFKIAGGHAQPAAIPVGNRRVHPYPILPAVADVYVDDQRVWLTGEVAALFERIRIWLMGRPDWVLQIEGYCDRRNSVSYAMALSQQRIDGIREFIVALGVDPGKVRLVNYGAEATLCRANTSRCREERLRVQRVFRLLAIEEPRRGCLARLRLLAPSQLGQGAFSSFKVPRLLFLKRILLATRRDSE